MELTIPFQQLDSESDLPEDERELLKQALKAGELAWAPYSNFHVGCAVQLVDGSVITGNNQENRAFPSGLCAERVALFHAGAMGMGGKVRKIAIRARSKEKTVSEPIAPCGACRQVMLEYEQIGGSPLTVIMQGETGKILKVKGVAGALLPFAFEFDF